VAESIDFRLKVIEDSLAKSLEANEKRAKSLSESIAGVTTTLRNVGSFVGFAGIAATLRSTVTEAAKFSRSISEINSVLPANTKLTKDQEKALAQLSERYGTSAEAQAKGFFEAVSNGIEDTATAAKILKSANDAALSGLVDLNTASRLITSTFNAYATSGTTAAQVTDTLVAVTQVSGIKFEELASTVGRVTNVAAQSGVSIGELGGTLAFLNQRSVTTEQAVTGLAGILNEVSKPSQEAQREALRLGISFNQAALQSKGLVGFLQEVSEKTNGNVASLRQLFGDQRAANAIIAIATSQFSEYGAVVDRVTNSQGEAARASKVIRESLDFKLDTSGNSFNSLVITIGEKFIPLIDAAGKSALLFKNIIGSSTKSLDENKNKLSDLANEYNNVVDRIAEYNKTQDGSESQAKKALEARLSAILSERQALRDLQADKAKAENASGATTTASSNPQVIALTEAEKQIKEKYANIAMLRETAVLEEENFKAEAANLAITNDIARQEAEIERLFAYETRKKDIETQFALEKAAITGGPIQAAEEERIAAERLIAIKTATGKKIVELDKNQKAAQKAEGTKYKKWEDQTSEERVATVQTTLGQISTLQQSSNKTAAALGKAAAITSATIDGIRAVQLTLATIPPPFSFAAAAAVGAAAALNVSKIAGVKGFAEGGVIGSTDGATRGQDNKLATVRTGEMVLNADQQKNLFDFINNGASSGGEIVVQIDGREVARAVRSQIKGGFRLA